MDYNQPLSLSLCNQTAMLDDETAAMFKKELISNIKMLETLQVALLGVGVGIFVLCLVGFFIAKRRDNLSKMA